MTDSPNGVVLAGDVALPSGGHVVFRDPAQLRAKDKKYVIRSITDEGGRWSRTVDATEGTVCMLVEKWTIPYLPAAPLPRDMPEILGELTIPDYDKLIEAATPAVGLLFPSDSADDADKPGSPTVPAGD